MYMPEEQVIGSKIRRSNCSLLSQHDECPPMVNVYHVFQNGKAGSCFESNKMACLEKEARLPIRKTTISLFGNRVYQRRGAGGIKFAYAN
jgi:hypothetical protein